jgi:hypothetical protein
MNRILEIKDVPGIEKINDFVHDCEFDLSKIQFSKSLGVVDISFRKTLQDQQVYLAGTIVKKVKAPIFTFHFVASTVSNVKIEDPDEIEVYDFAQIEYDKGQSMITIHTGARLGFWIWVESIDISIFQETEPLGFETYRTF